MPRAALAVAYVLLNCDHGATYDGLRFALGHRSSSAVRKAVRLAKERALVHVIVGSGRSGATVVYLRAPVRRLLTQLFKRKASPDA